MDFKPQFQSLLDELLAKPVVYGENVARSAMLEPKTTHPKEVRFARLEGQIRKALADADNSDDAHNGATLDALREEFDKLDDVPIPHIGDVD